VVSQSYPGPPELRRESSRLHGNRRIAHVTSPILDWLAITLLVARICQSSVHLLVEQTNTVAGIRFAFFFVQAICMIAMGVLIAIWAPSWSA
jgi:hypothetical protein